MRAGFIDQFDHMHRHPPQPTTNAHPNPNPDPITRVGYTVHLGLRTPQTSSKAYLNSKDYAWQHGQFQLDTKRGITYLMDFEKPGNPKQFQRIRMFRPISSLVGTSTA